MVIPALLIQPYTNSVISQPWSFLSPLKRKRTSKRTSTNVTFLGPFLHQAVAGTSLSWRSGLLSPVPCTATNSQGSGPEDGRVLDTVSKLYNAVKNRNTDELSDIIGDECRCVCNFFSFFQSIQGKQQVLDFFKFLIGKLGENVKFVMKPTLRDGMVVGAEWRIESRTSRTILGKGISFLILHEYRGHLHIRHVELFMEPLVYVEPYRLKLLGYVMTITDKMSYYRQSNKVKVAVLILLFVVTSLIFLTAGTFS
ncbi:hypothetical protein K2173_017947 [Erythroxylum novogranatense]|uniref:SnoaL-like domain-containing protein n=1 Tax=Erythroxylum novogranatense TaxID=1862640 RepID=A0AAV8TU25_9ROSI|nr:hypothetical protein K2173_017947 [Erythroxylum novogranatense]